MLLLVVVLLLLEWILRCGYICGDFCPHATVLRMSKDVSCLWEWWTLDVLCFFRTRWTDTLSMMPSTHPSGRCLHGHDTKQLLKLSASRYDIIITQPWHGALENSQHTKTKERPSQVGSRYLHSGWQPLSARRTISAVTKKEAKKKPQTLHKMSNFFVTGPL